MKELILIASLLLTSNSWAEELPPLNADDIASTEYVSNRCWALTRTISWFAAEKEFKEKEIVDPGEIKKREKYWISVLFHTVTENHGYELYSIEAMEHIKETHYIYLAAYKDGANEHIDKTAVCCLSWLELMVSFVVKLVGIKIESQKYE